MPSKWKNSHKPRGERIRLACEKLGPIFVKFGQLLSTRLDVLPDDIAKELVKLQDSVKPFSEHKARDIIKSSYVEPIDQLFTKIDYKPLASASIAQVHSAELLDGREVVLKILRPKIKKKIMLDVGLMLSFAQLAEKYLPNSRRFRPVEVVEEFKKIIIDELDLQREAANASQLRRNFQDTDVLYVPEIYWQFSNTNVITMERIHGVPVSNIETLKRNSVNLKLLAIRGVEIFFTQVFKDCFFHADMHPGNVWVDISNPQDPKYMALDFGIIGTLSPKDQHYLAENFMAFFNRDYRRVAELHVESGWVPYDTRVDEFESAIRSVCEPIFEKPLSEISFGKTLLRLFQVARRFEMEVQPQLVLLQKTLISVEGLGRQLYPELDLWTTARPFLEEWMRSRVGLKALGKKIKYYSPYWLEKLPEVPDLIFKSLQMVASYNKVSDNEKDKSKCNNNFISGVFIGISVVFLLLTLATQLEPKLFQCVSNRHIIMVALTSAILSLLLGRYFKLKV